VSRLLSGRYSVPDSRLHSHKMDMSSNNCIEETHGDGDPPPIDEGLFLGPPPTALCDFDQARLRQFPKTVPKIKRRDFLGKGREGIVYKATIGSDPVAVKIVRGLATNYSARQLLSINVSSSSGVLSGLSDENYQTTTDSGPSSGLSKRNVAPLH
jgi:hypothetical protein